MHEVLISLLAWRRELIHEVCISPRCAEPPVRLGGFYEKR